MDLDVSTLTRAEWLSAPEGTEPGDDGAIRLVFRRDSTGYYERENGPGKRFVRENLLFRVEGRVLHLKFARARGWTEVEASFEMTDGASERFIGRLVLARDPYAWLMEERATDALVLTGDRGAALPTE